MTSLIDFAHSLGLWLCTYALHSTLLLALAFVIVRSLRAHPHRERVWRAALLGGVLTASLQHAGIVSIGFESARLELPAPVVALTSEPGTAQPIGIVGVSPIPRAADRSIAPAGAAAMSPLGRLRWPAILGALWIALAGVLVTRLFLARRRMLNSLPRRPIHDPEVMSEVRSLLSNTRFGRGVRVSESPALASPIAIGSREICVPRTGWNGLDAAHRSSLLAHEIAHLVRRDPAWLMATHAFERVFFVQPLNRVARRELAAEAEFLCDDWAAERTGRPERLAGCLAEVASWVSQNSAPLLAPAMAHGPSSLVKRVERLLADREAPPSRGAKIAVASGCALAIAVLACAGPSVDIAAEPVITAQIEKREDPFALVRVSREGIAETYRGERRLGTADLNNDAGVLDLTSTLEIVAAAMPRGDDPPFPSGRLQIQIEEGGLFRHVQKIMERCGTYNVSIWNLEVVGVDESSEVYPVPLPYDLGVDGDLTEIVEEEEEPSDDEPNVHRTPLPTTVGVHAGNAPPRTEILVKTRSVRGRRSVSYRIGTNRWTVDDTGSVRERDAERTFKPFETTSTESLEQVLAKLAAKDPDQRITIDARAGTVYRDIDVLLSLIKEAGFTNILFVGSYE